MSLISTPLPLGIDSTVLDIDGINLKLWDISTIPYLPYSFQEYPSCKKEITGDTDSPRWQEAEKGTVQGNSKVRYANIYATGCSEAELKLENHGLSITASGTTFGKEYKREYFLDMSTETISNVERINYEVQSGIIHIELTLKEKYPDIQIVKGLAE